MLALERRVLEPLLPSVAGKDVVDLGCGTGRWLEALKNSGTRSLVGLDYSREMLARATRKLAGAAKLVCADCINAPLRVASADVVLCSFVLSYLEDAKSFLDSVKQLLRPGGSLFVTDIHPDTASALNWRRRIRTPNGFEEIRTRQRSIEEIISLGERVGLRSVLRVEPQFGEEERIVFEQNGKGQYFDEIGKLPAIYILQFTSSNDSGSQPQYALHGVREIHGARFALDGRTNLEGEVHIADSRMEIIRSEAPVRQPRIRADASLDLRGFLVLPGLINAHDHLEFGLFPRLGKGGYKNFLEWAEDIHHPGASPVVEHRQVPRDVRLWWGGIRNVLCGVTTVCHHNPYDPEVFSNDFIVRVLKDYGWAHSLALEPDAAVKKEQTPAGRPFLIHLGEGVDEQSAEEIFQLSRAGALDADTVVIHGLGIGIKGIELLRSAGAGLIWCPTSNQFLFGRTLTHKELQALPKVALGSDSALTAKGDLLDEIRYAYEVLETPARDLYGYVTRGPAKLLALRDGEGQFRPGASADLIAVRHRGLTPAETLAQLSYRDIELVLLGGRVQLASTELMRRLPARAREGLRCLSIEGMDRWIRAPLGRLFAETAPHLGDEIYLGGKKVRLGMENCG
jgi:cytosine/adenosine deaminase-related metal-dependent hydrolase/SAM-dependent methyltransferase